MVMRIDKALIKIPETMKPMEELISCHEYIYHKPADENIENQLTQGFRTKEAQKPPAAKC